MDEKELEEFLGAVGYRDYTQAPDWDKPNIQEWAEQLKAADDREFVLMTSSAILDEAIMDSRYKGNNYGYYARTSGAHAEAKRRHVAAGHDESCYGATLYSKAHDSIMRGQGHTPRPAPKCSCGRDK